MRKIQLYGTTPDWILTKCEAIEQWLKDNHCDRYVTVEDAMQVIKLLNNKS